MRCNTRREDRFHFPSMYVRLRAVHDMLNNNNNVHIYESRKRVHLDVLKRSKVMKQFWGCYNMGSYYYVIQMLLMSRVLPGDTEVHSGIQG